MSESQVWFWSSPLSACAAEGLDCAGTFHRVSKAAAPGSWPLGVCEASLSGSGTPALSQTPQLGLGILSESLLLPSEPGLESWGFPAA